VAVCIFGVVLIIGVDFNLFADGRIVGYLLAFGCVITWNIYNFITVKLHDDYSTVSLTFNQIVCTLLFLVPYVLRGASELPAFTPALIGKLMYIGILSGGVGFLVQVRALYVVGPTVTVLFINFLPVTTTFFGWLLLKETITPVQMIGGAIVLAAGYYVIKEKGKTEELINE
jgi:drug/metabolite transporter (DMT)-like permease